MFRNGFRVWTRPPAGITADLNETLSLEAQGAQKHREEWLNATRRSRSSSPAAPPGPRAVRACGGRGRRAQDPATLPGRSARPAARRAGRAGPPRRAARQHEHAADDEQRDRDAAPRRGGATEAGIACVGAKREGGIDAGIPWVGADGGGIEAGMACVAAMGGGADAPHRQGRDLRPEPTRGPRAGRPSRARGPSAKVGGDDSRSDGGWDGAGA